MCLMKVTLLLLLSLALSNGMNGYLNDVGDPIMFQCTSGYGLVRVQSTHDTTGGSDRKWKFECTKIDIWRKEYCYWYTGINELQEAMFFQCPPDAFMAGLRSTYDTTAMDRVWDVKCCRIETICMQHCGLSGALGENTMPIDYSADEDACDSVFVGIYSEFSSVTNDRDFRLQHCQFGSCSNPKKYLYKK